MKIIRENKVYIQKNDVMFLTHLEMGIPASIFLKVVGHNVCIVDDSNRYDFVEFDDQVSMDFIKGIDFVADYDICKSLTKPEIMKIGESISDERNRLANKFNSMSKKEKEKNKGIPEECDKLEYKMYSLRDACWFFEGHLKMNIPEDIKAEDPEMYNKNKVKQFFKKIFKGKNNE